MKYRYKLVIEYEGTKFHGWQRQFPSTLPTVQGTLESAFKFIFNYNIKVEGSGRTDAGVHATGQTAHVELLEQVDTLKICERLNFLTKNTGVVVLQLEATNSDFHARFCAKKRTYVYKIINRHCPLVLYQNKAWHVDAPLDVEQMQQAANLLIGLHDFSAFRASQCQSTNVVKNIEKLSVVKAEELITIEVTSRSFLHNQVRIMVGTLKEIGEGRYLPSNITSIINSCNRKNAGITAPAFGLYLTKVEY